MVDANAVLTHYTKPVPRYTSYPAAPQFQADAGQGLFLRNAPRLSRTEPVSVYIHIPYCDRLCWFCGCHTKHTLKYAPIAQYVQTLCKEIQLTADTLGFRPILSNLHLGGGSPSLLKQAELQQLRHALDKAFEIKANCEISVEIDPSDIEPDGIDELVAFGLNRASIGVQDFHPDVQAAINRPQPFEQTRDVVGLLRDSGVKSINIDALYGLPRQNKSRLMRTLEQCVEICPDRMALFGYAHVPWLKKHQNLIKTDELPDQFERYDHATQASQLLQTSGYQPIGIDHFARPADPLAQAARNGRLRRNFQGYTTDARPTMIGFGASSIGRFADSFVQNIVPIGQYLAKVQHDELPKQKGLQLSEEDQLRGEIIERLMCQFSIDFDTLDHHSPDLVRACLRTANKLVSSDRFGLCELSGNRFSIRPQARAFTRIVAAHFDAYYAPQQHRYSKAV